METYSEDQRPTNHLTRKLSISSITYPYKILIYAGIFFTVLVLLALVAIVIILIFHDDNRIYEERRALDRYYESAYGNLYNNGRYLNPYNYGK